MVARSSDSRLVNAIMAAEEAVRYRHLACLRGEGVRTVLYFSSRPFLLSVAKPYMYRA